MTFNETIQDPDEDSAFEELSTLLEETSSEPDDTNLSPTQASSDDGQVVELGQDSDNIKTKDI